MVAIFDSQTTCRQVNLCPFTARFLLKWKGLFFTLMSLSIQLFFHSRMNTAWIQWIEYVEYDAYCFANRNRFPRATLRKLDAN